MDATYIELGGNQTRFVNASQVTTIELDHQGRIKLCVPGTGNLYFHDDQIEGSTGRQVLIALLTELGKTPAAAGTRIITYLDGSVQSRHLS